MVLLSLKQGIRLAYGFVEFENRSNRYFTFQTIFNMIGACGTISFFWYAWIVEVLFEQFLIRNAV